MRNLKKFLALVLAMMMIFSMMVTVSAKDVSKYGDVDEDNDFYKAIAVLSGMNVLEGDDSGFRPDDTITRAEMAAVIYRIYTGKVGDAGKTNAGLYADYENAFTDVKGGGSDWALGYINFDYANGLVKGDPDKMYRPADPVTGYEVLAMVLRAVGYGKEGEFEGSNYTYQVAYRASLLGITTNIKDGTLGQKATRAQVAEMVFQAVQAKQANWSQLGSYYTTETLMSETPTKSLGEQHFYLTHGDLHVNAWGRPSDRWYNYNTNGNYANLMYKPVATFSNIKDECDVIDEFGIKQDDIVRYFEDNVELSPSNATGDKDSSIDEDGVGSTMGGMGSITEIYKKSNGDYWIVKINTYLALVTDVHTPEPDKHDHIAKRTVDLKLFIDASSNTVDTGVVSKDYETDETSYIEGKYIRVNIDKANKAHVEQNDQKKYTPYDLGLAEPLVVGDYKENFAAAYPDPARTVITVSPTKDETKYDSEKFVLNAHRSDTWVFLNDGYGNILGQAEANFKYGVIGAIAWFNNGLEPGHAEAKIYPVDQLNTRSDDGYFIKTVTNLNGAAAKNAEESQTDKINADPHWSEVYDSVGNNTALTGHLVVYSENDDGTIDIVTHAYDAARNNVYFGDRMTSRMIDGTPGDTDRNGKMSPYTVEKGQSNVKTKGNSVMAKANDYTVYLIENEDGGFDRYVGMRNVPTTSGTGVCILEGENGYAQLVVLTKTKDDTSRTFVAFVGNAAIATEGSATARRTVKVQNASDEIYYAHDVYELGVYNGAATKVYDLATNNSAPMNVATSNEGYKWDATVANAGPGLYEFTVDGNSVIESMRPLVALATPTVNESIDASQDTVNNYWYANLATRIKVVGNAMAAATYGSVASGEASPDNATVNDIGFNIYDATVIKVKQTKAASAGKVASTDIFTVGQWNKSDAIPANAIVLVVYERAASANRNNWTAYVYVLAEPDMATADKVSESSVTPPDCVKVYTKYNDTSKNITTQDRIVIVATDTITVEEGRAAIEAYFKAAGYSIADLEVSIASNGEHTYKVTSTSGSLTYNETFYWNPETDVVLGMIVQTEDGKSVVVPEGFTYANVGRMSGLTATSDLGTYVKVTSAGEEATAAMLDISTEASDGDTVEFGYFQIASGSGNGGLIAANGGTTGARFTFGTKGDANNTASSAAIGYLEFLDTATNGESGNSDVIYTKAKTITVKITIATVAACDGSNSNIQVSVGNASFSAVDGVSLDDINGAHVASWTIASSDVTSVGEIKSVELTINIKQIGDVKIDAWITAVTDPNAS